MTSSKQSVCPVKHTCLSHVYHAMPLQTSDMGKCSRALITRVKFQRSVAWSIHHILFKLLVIGETGISIIIVGIFSIGRSSIGSVARDAGISIGGGCSSLKCFFNGPFVIVLGNFKWNLIGTFQFFFVQITYHFTFDAFNHHVIGYIDFGLWPNDHE